MREIIPCAQKEIFSFKNFFKTGLDWFGMPGVSVRGPQTAPTPQIAGARKASTVYATHLRHALPFHLRQVQPHRS
jgi:hypothetical protein